MVGVSSTKKLSSGIVDLDGGWKLFYSGANPSISAQASLGILISPQLSGCVFDRISLESRTCMLKLKLNNRSLCLLQMYAVSKYQASVDNVNEALQRVGSTKSLILSGDFNGHIRTYSET